MNMPQKLLAAKDYQRLPKAVQGFHEHPEYAWQGSVIIQGTNTLILKIIRAIVGLPNPQHTHNITLNIQHKGDETQWIRQFNDTHFKSSLGLDPSKTLMYERLGVLKFYFSLRVEAAILHWDLHHVTLANIRLPTWLRPKTLAQESESTTGHYQFKAYVKLPLLGVLLDYTGELRHSNP